MEEILVVLTVAFAGLWFGARTLKKLRRSTQGSCDVGCAGCGCSGLPPKTSGAPCGGLDSAHTHQERLLQSPSREIHQP